MERHPDTVKPRDVESFNPKDRAIIALIDEALADVVPLRRPGELGAVVCKPSLELPDPPEAA